MEDPIVVKRKSNFSLEEDDLIVQCWMLVSEDPIIGTDQKKALFWDRIAQLFNEKIPQGKEDRSGRALENRFRKVQEFINKFHGIHNKVLEENISGKNEADKYKLARGRFHAQTQKEFIWKSSYEFVRDKPKWMSVTQAIQHKETLANARKKSGGVVEVDDDGDEVVLVDKMGKTMGRSKSKVLKALAEANVKHLEETQAVMKSLVEGYKEDKKEKKVENRKKMKFLEETSEMNKELILKRDRAVIAREKIAETLASQEARKKRDNDLLILKEEPDSIMDEERKNTIKKLQQHVIDYYK